jgi:hypothetical protein
VKNDDDLVFFDKCIFCSSELTSHEKRAKGEHVIPKCLHGSLCMSGVCAKCNSELGRTVDHKAIEDERIISAVLELELPDIETSILDKRDSRLVDPVEGHTLRVTSKKGKACVDPKLIRDGFLICGEGDEPTHILNMLRKRPELDHDEATKIVNEALIPRYRQAELGEYVSDNRIGVTLRKAPAEFESEWKTTPGACLPLIAKIGYETAFLSFDKARLLDTPDLNHLLAVAAGVAEPARRVFLYPPASVNDPPRKADYLHQIAIYYEFFGTVIDIYLFGRVGFRLMLRGDAPMGQGSLPDTKGAITAQCITMTFYPGKPKCRCLKVCRVGSSEADVIELP